MVVTGISNEVLYQEFLAVSRTLEQAVAAMSETRLEMQKLLWECGYGRQHIDHASRDYDERVTRRARAENIQ